MSYLGFDFFLKNGGSSGVGLSLILPIFKHCDFRFSTFLKIQNDPLKLVQN
jgi:hypothetical protein